MSQFNDDMAAQRLTAAITYAEVSEISALKALAQRIGHEVLREKRLTADAVINIIERELQDMIGTVMAADAIKAEHDELVIAGTYYED